MLKNFLQAKGKTISARNMGLYKGMKSTKNVTKWVNTLNILFSYYLNSLKYIRWFK